MANSIKEQLTNTKFGLSADVLDQMLSRDSYSKEEVKIIINSIFEEIAFSMDNMCYPDVIEKRKKLRF